MRVRRNNSCHDVKRKTDKRPDRTIALVRTGCLVFLLIMTRLCAAAETLQAAEETEKPVIRIVLRPEKEEGEADPDLTDEIRMQICAQTGADPVLADRLCACVGWTYVYDEEVRPPGETRTPGESDIYLTFAEDPEFEFSGWTLPEEDTDYPEEESEEEVDYPEEEPEEDTDYPEEEPEEEADYPEEETEEDAYYPEEGSEQAEYSEEDTDSAEEFTEPEDVTEWNEDTDQEALRSFLTTRPRGEETVSGEDMIRETDTAEETADADEFYAADEPAEEFFIEDEGGEDLCEEETGIEQEVSVEYTSDQKNTSQKKYEEVFTVPQELTESVTELIREPETAEAAEEAEEAEVQTQVQLLRTDSGSREEDLTYIYREALAGTDPEKLNWETLLAPLPENDGTYVVRTTEMDGTGKEDVRETAFSINRFGSVYTYNDVIQALRGNTVKSVERALVVSEYNPDTVAEDSREVVITRDGTPVGQALYTVSTAGTKRDGSPDPAGKAEEKKKWNRYDYVISAENFREDGVYSLNVSSRDSAGNTSEMHQYNGGGITFTVDGSPPELQSVQGLENAVVNGRKADVRVTAFDTVGLTRLSAFVDGKLMATEDSFSDRHRAELAFSIPQGPAQKVRIVAEDTAGNILDTDEKTSENGYRFQPAFPFFRQITVTPPPVPDKPKPRGPAIILILLIIGCAGASAGMLRHIFRNEKKNRRGFWDGLKHSAAEGLQR